MIANLQKLFISNISVLERGTSKVTPEKHQPASTEIVENHSEITIESADHEIANTSQASSSPSSNSSNHQTNHHSIIYSITHSIIHTNSSYQQQNQTIITGLKPIIFQKPKASYNISNKMTQEVQGDVPNINYTINIENLKDGALKIASFVRPQWKLSDVNCKIFTDGITNRLIGVYHHSDMNEMILIRVYGENTDLFINRALELRNMQIMHQAGLSAPVYCSFNNGISYGYSPGLVLDSDSVRDDHISGLIAETMATMHTLTSERRPTIDKNFYSSDTDASLFPGINKFLVLISSAFPIANGCKKLKSICNIDKLDLEVYFLERELRRINSPIVFCHNDLLLKNIVYSKSHNKVFFIDFEYSDYNYQAFDIANHFSEFCGVDNFNSSLYPSKEFQIKWLERYLRQWYKLTGNDNKKPEKFNEDVNKLYDSVNKFTLASHLYWGLWALVQATNSSIDFDYLNYAQMRIGEYFRRKELLFEDECTCRLSAHNGDGSF